MKASLIRLVLVFLFLAQAAVFGQEEKTKITIVNKSDLKIIDLAIALESADSWEMIELEKESLNPNDSIEIAFDFGEDCIWDLLVTDSDYNEYIVSGNDLCKEKIINIVITKEEEQDEHEEVE